MKQLYKNLLLVPIASLATLSAHAQESRQETGAAVSAITKKDIERFSARPIDELVTTARRSEESILEVPIAISTLTEEDIEKGGIRGIEDVAAFTPGLSFANFFGQALPRPVIRGVAPVDIFGESNASVYIDGIFVSSSTGINFSFIDLERVEVLKGPQGAYFGNSAFSGAINYVTRKPADELQIRGELTAGTADTLRALTSIEGPLVGDVLSGRVSFLYDDFGGTYNNQSDIDQDIGGRQYKTVSSSLFFTPVDSFSAQLNLYYSDDAIDPPAQSTTPANCEAAVTGTDPQTRNRDRKLNFCGDVPRAGQNDLSTIAGETGQQREVFRSTLNMNWATDFGTFSSLTGFSDTTDLSFDNGNPGATNTLYQYANGPIFGTNLPTGNLFNAGGLLFENVGEAQNKDFSQELRFTSPTDRSLRYTVGAYYFKQETDVPRPWRTVNAENSLPDDFVSFGCPACGSIPGFGFLQFFDVGGSVFGPWFSNLPNRNAGFLRGDVRNAAVFGSIEYDFSDKWTGYADIRYTDTKVTDDTLAITYDYDISSDTINDANTTSTASSTQNKDEFITWRASLSYAPTDYSSIYGSIATGEKGGGVTSFTVDGASNPDFEDRVIQQKFGPEKNITYELGYKAALNEGRTVVDAAVYYTDWSDIVIPVINDSFVNPDDPSEIIDVAQVFTISQNAGDASIAGFELSVRSQLSDFVNAGFGASYNQAELDNGFIASFAEFPSFFPDADMSGQTLPRQPQLQLNANVTFRDQLTGDWDWFVRGDAFYQSRWYVGLPNQAQIPSRVISNLRLGIESETVSVELWARNLFDNDAPTAAFRDPYFSNSLQDPANPGAPSSPDGGVFFPFRLSIANAELRVIGATVRVRFGG